MSILGDRIIRARERKNWTQGQLATYAQLDQSYLSLIEGGKRNNPSLGHLRKIAHALETSVDYLLGLTDDPRPAAVLHTSESKALAQSMGQLLADNSGRHLIELLVTMAPEDITQVLLYARYIALRQQTGDLTIAEISERLFGPPRQSGS